MTANTSPLAGLRVVELARILAGPWVGQTLGDLGAEVIKVESPDGDDTRQWGPPFMKRGEAGGDGHAAYFHAANRSKSSVTCDFNNPVDLERLKGLISEADVLIENFKVGGLVKYGLHYAAVAALNPRIIYVSITGFGQDGPRASQPGYDLLLQGMSGIMDLTGEPDREPQKVGVAWIDVFAGIYGVVGVQSALLERERSGHGQQIDVALLDVGVAVLANQATNFLSQGISPVRMGNAHPNIVPYQVFPVRDGHAIVACGNDRQFRALCGVLGLDDLAQSPLAATNPARVANREMVCSVITGRTSLENKVSLIAKLEEAGVPCGPINSVAQALSEPQVLFRGMRIDPEGIPGIRTPLRFSRSPLALHKAAPTLGSGSWEWAEK